MEVRGGGREEQPMPEARSGGQEDQPHIQVAMAVRAQEGLEELSTLKIRKGGHEEIPLIQGKRNPSKTVGVARRHQRAGTLKP